MQENSNKFVNNITKRIKEVIRPMDNVFHFLSIKTFLHCLKRHLKHLSYVAENKVLFKGKG